MLYPFTHSNSTQDFLNYTSREEDGSVHIDVSLAGVPKEDISLNYSSDNRTISMVINEKSYGDIYLSRQIDHKNITANLELGILKIRAPIKNNDKVIQIT